MKQLYFRNTNLAAVLMATMAAASTAHATPDDSYFERSLQRGAVEDVTPAQKYRSAIREAGGAYKEAKRDCQQAAVESRAACLRDAKANYDREMAEAASILRR